MKPSIVKYILEKYSITEYLGKKGIEPAKVYGEREVYLCPLHDDKDPSFYVFENNEYQIFKCYGCGKYGDVINLCSELENISLKESIISLAEGYVFNKDVILEDVLQEMEEYMEDKLKYNIEDLMIKINRSCYDYLDMVSFDGEELKVIDKIMYNVDMALKNMNVNLLYNMYNFMVEKGFKKRLKNFSLTKERESKDLIRKNLEK